MIINGKIYYQIESGGGTDENDDPIPVVTEWSDAIECNYKTNTYSGKGKYESGNFIMASFDILIEADVFDATRVKLEDLNGRNLGDYAVQSISPLLSVGRIKIVV